MGVMNLFPGIPDFWIFLGILAVAFYAMLCGLYRLDHGHWPTPIELLKELQRSIRHPDRSS